MFSETVSWHGTNLTVADLRVLATNASHLPDDTPVHVEKDPTSTSPGGTITISFSFQRVTS